VFIAYWAQPAATTGAFVLPAWPFAEAALEPFISALK
jgi:hypothetical protein